MPRFLVSYDLKMTNPAPHTEFLNQAGKQGWNRWILGNDSYWHYLPNTTLEGTFTDAPTAKTAIDRAVIATGQALKVTVTVEKYIMAEFAYATFRSDVTQRKN